MNTVPLSSNTSELNLADSDHNVGIALHSTHAQRLMSIPSAAADKPLTREEFDTVLARADADPDAADLVDILTILFHTGLRAGELARLEWKSVRLDQRQLTVMPVRGQSRRKVPFGHKVQRILEARKEQAPCSNYVLGNAPYRTLEKARRKLFDLQSGSGGRPISLHLLRQTFFFRWVSNCGGFEELSLITGCPLPAQNRKSRLSKAQLLASAALFQARLEDE
jgi:integrase